MMQKNMKCKLQCDVIKISKEFVVCIVIEMNAKHLFPRSFWYIRHIQHLPIVCFQLVFLFLLEMPKLCNGLATVTPSTLLQKHLILDGIQIWITSV
jgi:hypothetical protein